MQEYCFILPQASNRNLYNISRLHESRLAPSNNAATLSSICFKPSVHEFEVFTAVIDFGIRVPLRLSCSDNRQVFRPAVSRTRHVLRKMNRSVRVVSYAQEQYLPVILVDSTDRTVQTVKHVQGM
jgi:hypothetical protein